MTLKKKAQNFLKKAAINVIRARKKRAAWEVAEFLVTHNADFRNASTADLAQRIAKANLKEIESAV
jgi:hypothetical protein